MRKRASKADWLSTALAVLEAEGVEAVTVGRLARELGIARSGFYWHFENLADLRAGLLAHWAHEDTEVVTRNPEFLTLPPVDRLRRIAEFILEYDFTRLEAAMLAWASRDPAVARAVRRVYRDRLAFAGRAFEELGFSGEELEMRTRLFITYHAFERSMYRRESKTRLRRLIDRRIALLTRS